MSTVKKERPERASDDVVDGWGSGKYFEGRLWIITLSKHYRLNCKNVFPGSATKPQKHPAVLEGGYWARSAGFRGSVIDLQPETQFSLLFPVSYWARVYSLQLGIKTSKQPDEKAFLLTIMDWLENFKNANKNNDSITNDTVGQASVGDIDPTDSYCCSTFLGLPGKLCS